jgi:hypothetical protein
MGLISIHGHKRGSKIRDLLKQFSDADTPASAADGTLQNPYLRTLSCFLVKLGDSRRKPTKSLGLHQLCHLVIKALKLCDFFVEHGARKCIECLFLLNDIIYQGSIKAFKIRPSTFACCKPWL